MEENSSSSGHRKPRFNKNFSKLLLLLGALILLGVAGYFFMQYQNTKNLLQNPNQASDQEAKTLLEKVGKLIELPLNENPTIATVSDVTKLADQPFFANAKNGDKVLIYANVKKAILYRPSTNKIIEVAPVNIGNNNQPNPNPTSTSLVTPILTPTVTPSITVAPTKKLTPTPTITP